MATLTRVPRVAVVLPVYNGERFLAEAVRSVLEQTFADFELVVVDDGSTDSSGEILGSFADSRLRVIHCPVNGGIAAALNRGIQETKSELIARMDADDICLPRRLERQVAFLDAHPEVALCGTWTRQFGSMWGVSRAPVEPKRIRAWLCFGWAMEHPSIMMRRTFLERHGLAYDEEFEYAEDLEFFMRATELTRLANLPEVLLRTREHSGSVSRVHEQEQRRTTSRLIVRQLRALVPDTTKEQEDFHIRVVGGTIETSELGRADQWLAHLDQVNRIKARYDMEAFSSELRRRSLNLRARSISAGLPVLLSYWNSPLSRRHVHRVVGCITLARRLGVARLIAFKRACMVLLHSHRASEPPGGDHYGRTPRSPHHHDE